MADPLVSIIVPTYNVERYIEECIESIINQTYENIEIIVIDDGSVDATAYLLEQFKNHIQIKKNKTNKGQGVRRNEGLGIAKGEYVFFVDSDDIIAPDTVEKVIKLLLQTQTDMVRFNAKVLYEGDIALLEKHNYDFSHSLQNKMVYHGEDLLKKNSKSFSPSPCLYIVKKEVIDNNNLSFLEGVIHEDEYFTTCLFTVISNMSYLDEVFYHRRFRVASTMTLNSKAHKLKSFNSYLTVFRELEKFYKHEDLSVEQKKFVKRQMLSVYSGLKRAEVPMDYAIKLKQLNSITIKDKVFIMLSEFKQKLYRYR